MKLFRNTIILLVVLVGLLGYYYYTQKTAKPAESNVVLDIKKSDIASINIDQGGKNLLSLTRVNGKWEMTKPIKYDVDSINLNDLLNTASSMKAERKFSSNDLGKYGLDRPAYTAYIGLSNNKNIELKIGNKSPVGMSYFVKVSDKPDVYMVQATDVEKFMLSNDYVYQYAQKYIFLTAKDKINKIAYIKSGNEYPIQKNKDGSWVINGKKLNNNDVDKLLDDIVLLQISGIDLGKSPSKDKYDFGLAVYGDNSEEKAYFVTRDKNSSYVIKDDKSLGMYTSSDKLAELLSDLMRVIK